MSQRRYGSRRIGQEPRELEPRSSPHEERRQAKAAKTFAALARRLDRAAASRRPAISRQLELARKARAPR